ncbi:MAG: riboflavin synthase [Candidatus Omnitrophota bacterium]|nr:riboflavin synthase [Candidatus Omnitrophota bacterium]
MFTGIIKELGTVRSFGGSGKTRRLDVSAKDICGRVVIGDSVAVNGACLTVVEKRNGTLAFDVMAETLRKSGLEGLKRGDLVNLEDSLRTDDALGGHFVLGHIDCIGKIKNMLKFSGEFMLEINMPAKYSNLIVEKGSIALDGISLTVAKPSENSFKVYIIPHTLGNTALGSKHPGDEVNIEFDVIGKYIAKYLAGQDVNGSKKNPILNEKFLREKGF